MRIFLAVCLAGGVWAQGLTVEGPERKLPAHVEEKLSAADRVLFGRMMRVGLEASCFMGLPRVPFIIWRNRYFKL